MGTFSDLTLQELRGYTVTQIRTALKNKIDAASKAQLIRFILSRVDVDAAVPCYDPPVKTLDAVGNLLSAILVKRDVLGNKLGTEKDERTYYATGELDTRTLTTLDASDAVIATKVIKHFTDGRQPEVT